MIPRCVLRVLYGLTNPPRPLGVEVWDVERDCLIGVVDPEDFERVSQYLSGTKNEQLPEPPK